MMVWALVTVSFLTSERFGTTGFTPFSPLIVLSVLLIPLLNPVEIYQTRRSPWSLRTIGRVISAPFYHVEFRDFLCGDQLTSMVGPILDLEFTMYYLIFDYANQDATEGISTGHQAFRALLAAFPAWTRFAQCIRRYRDEPNDQKSLHPHLTNAGKYSCAFLVVLFSSLTGDTASPFFICWILAAVLNMCYTLYWDFIMDWGLFRKDSPHRFLRKSLMYPPWTYYVAIVYNVIGRMAWVLSISVGFFGYFDKDGIGSMLSLIEIVRRFSWNHFRFENEHLNNCGKFRATAEIPLPFEFVQSDEVNFGDKDAFNNDSTPRERSEVQPLAMAPIPLPSIVELKEELSPPPPTKASPQKFNTQKFNRHSATVTMV